MKRNFTFLFVMIFVLAAVPFANAQQLKGESPVGEAQAPVSLEEAATQVPQADIDESGNAGMTPYS